MIEWLFAIVAWLVPDADASALQRTARSYLDLEAAREHVAAARVAGSVYKIDPDLLRAIAWRESRYRVDAVTRERSGKLSCGLMMVTMPLGEPCPPHTILDGYLAGAAHLRSWIRLTRDTRKALLGYAGGYPTIARCEAGPIIRVRGGVEVDMCSLPELKRAAWIRQGRSRPSTRAVTIW